MGNGFGIRCKKCGYRYMGMTGIGYLFPVEYASTVKDIREGKYGEEYQKFFTEHEEAAVDCGNCTAICTECGQIEDVKNMSVYLPKDGYKYENYVLPSDLEENFDKCMEYDHKCSKCGSKMRIISLEDEIRSGTLNCPSCGDILVEDKEVKILWD